MYLLFYLSILTLKLQFIFFEGVNCFADTATVLNYISSGYVYKEALQSNTIYLTKLEYFNRYTNLSVSELPLVDASDIDYSTVTYPDKDITITDPYQSIMTVFYKAKSSIYESYY